MRATLAGLVGTLVAVQARLPLIFPLHPRTAARLQAAGLFVDLQALPHLVLTEPLGYLEFLGLLAAARLVLTDSGGIQEETTALGVRCFTLRDNTERPETEQGTNVLLGLQPDEIRRIPELLEQPVPGEVPELWDGRAGSRAADAIESLL